VVVAAVAVAAAAAVAAAGKLYTTASGLRLNALLHHPNKATGANCEIEPQQSGFQKDLPQIAGCLSQILQGYASVRCDVSLPLVNNQTREVLLFSLVFLTFFVENARTCHVLAALFASNSLKIPADKFVNLLV
jgi:hypothetical protein